MFAQTFDYDGRMEPLAHWWNRRWGAMVRRDVWVDRRCDGRYDVHWHGGQWRDRDGHFYATDRRVAWWAVRQLIEDGGDWLRVDLIGRSDQPDELQPVPDAIRAGVASDPTDRKDIDVVQDADQ